MARSNSINVIKPYKWEGMWVFDDPSVGLDKEPFVAGVPEIIEAVLAEQSIENGEQGFVLVFSAVPFPDHQYVLEWVQEQDGGNIYRLCGTDMEGWLCPAIFEYFETAPESLYFSVRSAAS